MSLGLDITFQMLPRIEPPPNQEQDHKPETLVTLFVDAHKPLVKIAIAKYLLSSTASLAAVVLDVFCISMIDVADELGIPAYVYFTSNAAMLSLMFYLNKYYYSLDINSNNLEGDICVAAFPPVPVFSVQMVMDKNDVACKMFLHHGQRYGEARGIIVNTFEELEPMALKVLVDGECLPSPDHPKLPVFPMGPLLVPEKTSDGSEPHECIKWLDGKPSASVVFLCFGSMGCFEQSQVKEMAKGIERSGHSFLWALSPSPDKFYHPTNSNLDEILPEGFLKRIGGRGIVWPSWVPQAEILAHPSIVGFVTHCGWNSSL